MRSLLVLAAVVVFAPGVFAPAVFAQGSPPAAAPNGPIMQSILPRLAELRQNIEETAQLIAEPDYSYKLTPAQRSVAEWFQHNVAMSYGSCSQISQTPPPAGTTYRGLTAKADLVKALKDSFDYCEQAFKSFNDETVVKPYQSGTRTASPVNVMVGLLTLWSDHYGNLVGYIRMKGLVPPSSSRVGNAKKK